MSHAVTIEIIVPLVDVGAIELRAADATDAVIRSLRESLYLGETIHVEAIGINAPSREDLVAGCRDALAAVKAQLADSEARCAQIAAELADVASMAAAMEASAREYAERHCDDVTGGAA